MIRTAFTMRLKPGGLADYTRWHDTIWPELVKELEVSGIYNMTIFENDPVLFLYSQNLGELTPEEMVVPLLITMALAAVAMMIGVERTRAFEVRLTMWITASRFSPLMVV